MQYDNKSEVETRRPIAKTIAALLFTLLIIPIFGTFDVTPEIWFSILIILLGIVMFAASGGLDIMYINIGNGYVEIMVSQFFSISKHRQKILQTESTNILGYAYRKVFFLRKFVIRYRKHSTNDECKVIMWLTMMSRRRRHDLCNTMSNIISQNKKHQQTTITK